MCRRTERESDMRFLGGLLKTIAIILLLAATAGCTAVAVLYGGTDVYWAMGILWTVALFIALTAWGTGHALAQVHKLKKKLERVLIIITHLEVQKYKVMTFYQALQIFKLIMFL